jgi:hypothetical protein
MTGKSGLVLFISASWVAPVALAGALAPGSDRLACPEDAPPLCGVAQSSLVAAARKALWSTAADALRDARGAFVQGDYQKAQRAAGIAIEQARMGIAQTAYPMFSFPSD